MQIQTASHTARNVLSAFNLATKPISLKRVARSGRRVITPKIFCEMPVRHVRAMRELNLETCFGWGGHRRFKAIARPRKGDATLARYEAHRLASIDACDSEK